MLVVLVGLGGVVGASLRALGSDLLDVIAKRQGLAVDVVSALLHRVVVASTGRAVVASSDDTLFAEPFPGRADLATVAAHRLALDEVAAGGGVRDGEEGSEVAACGDADTVIEGLGGAVSPARATVGLVADVVDHRVALGPLNARVEVDGEVVAENHGRVASALGDSPLRVNDGAHEALDLLEGGASELAVVASDPGGVRVGIDSLDVGGKVNGLLLTEEVKNVAVLAESNPLAGSLGLCNVNELSLVGEGVDAGLEGREHLIEVVELVVFALGGEFDGGLAELADVVVLSEELVGTAGAGNSGECG